MYHIVSEICIGGRFLEVCFDLCFQQIISAVANESFIPYNLIRTAPETQNLQCCNTECKSRPNQKNVQLSF